jgi:hypothetical protein
MNELFFKGQLDRIALMLKSGPSLHARGPRKPDMAQQEDKIKQYGKN